MLATAPRLEYSIGTVVPDGLGERLLAPEPECGEIVQVLRVPRALSEAPGFEFALRDRTSRLTAIKQASCARVYRVERLDPPAGDLTLVSQHVEGVRLSDLLLVAHERTVTVDISTSMAVIRQLLPALTMLHDHARDLACGLIAPERMVITPRGRVAVVEQALGGAIEQLHYGQSRLWNEFRIAAGPDSERVPFSHRTDVMSVGMVALALMLGRPLRQGEFPSGVSRLLDAARERSAAGHERPLSEPLREWLARALQLAPGTSFASAAEAWLAFERVIAGDPLYIPVPIALEMFLYSCTKARIPPHPIGTGPVERTCVDLESRRVQASEHGRAVPSEAPAEPPPAPGAEQSQPAPTGEWADAGGRLTDTSFDIAQLFSDTDPTPSAGADPQPVGSDPLFRAPGAPDGPRDESHAHVEPMPEAVLQAMDDAAAEPHWTRRLPLSPHLPPRSVAIGALLIALMTGGVLATRGLTSTVVTASGTGTLIVETNPPGLRILIDGSEQGMTPARLSVSAGDRTLEIHGADAVRVVQVRVGAGAEISHYLEFAAPAEVPERSPSRAELPDAAPTTASSNPRSAPETQTWGWLAVQAPFAVDVHVGGRHVATTSGQRVRIAEGRHQVEFRNAGRGYRSVRVVHVSAGKVTDVVLGAETES